MTAEYPACPLVNTREEFQEGRVVIEFKVPKLEKSNNPHTTKGEDEACITFFNSGMGFVMDATVKKGTNKEKIYQFTAKQLPSKICIVESDWRIEKEKIVLSLKKENPI